MVSAHMAALEFYQLALPIPAPKPGSFDQASATRGQAAFNGKAQCATCHVPPLFTEAGWNTHKLDLAAHAARSDGVAQVTCPAR